jgi:hypothetical protein
LLRGDDDRHTTVMQPALTMRAFQCTGWQANIQQRSRESVKNIQRAAKGLGVGGAALALIAGGALLAGGAAVAAGTITSGDIKDQTIQSRDIGPAGVGTSELRNNDVRRGDIKDGAVGPGEILDGSVRAADLDAGLADSLKGEKGDPGEQGPKGDTGEKGEKGDTGAPGLSELESDGPYPGATQLEEGANSDAKWVGDSGVTLQRSWVQCPDGKIAIGGGYSRADEAPASFKGLQVVSSQPAQIVDGDPTAYTPIEGDVDGSYVPNGWLVEGFNNNADGELIVRPHVVCAKVAQ